MIVLHCNPFFLSDSARRNIHSCCLFLSPLKSWKVRACWTCYLFFLQIEIIRPLFKTKTLRLCFRVWSWHYFKWTPDHRENEYCRKILENLFLKYWWVKTKYPKVLKVLIKFYKNYTYTFLSWFSTSAFYLLRITMLCTVKHM